MIIFFVLPLLLTVVWSVFERTMFWMEPAFTFFSYENFFFSSAITFVVLTQTRRSGTGVCKKTNNLEKFRFYPDFVAFASENQRIDGGNRWSRPCVTRNRRHRKCLPHRMYIAQFELFFSNGHCVEIHRPIFPRRFRMFFFDFVAFFLDAMSCFDTVGWACGDSRQEVGQGCDWEDRPP